MTIRIFTTGGTFDKVYFDALSEFRFGDTLVGDLLVEANVNFAYQVETLLQKDSLDLDDTDRELIRRAVEGADESRIVITHGTDTMVETARALAGIDGKTIVLFGAMQPARMRYTDAMYNLGVATAAVQLLTPGVHLAMNGQVFAPDRVRKNRARGRFEPIDGGSARRE